MCNSLLLGPITSLVIGPSKRELHPSRITRVSFTWTGCLLWLRPCPQVEALRYHAGQSLTSPVCPSHTSRKEALPGVTYRDSGAWSSHETVAPLPVVREFPLATFAEGKLHTRKFPTSFWPLPKRHARTHIHAIILIYQAHFNSHKHNLI
jgi:hypothetical protein